MLEVEARVHWRHDGAMPGNVLIVANHISWLDIFVLSSFQPARFIAKADLRRLPVVGRLIANVGTLFIERERRRDTHTVNRHTVEALEARRRRRGVSRGHDERRHRPPQVPQLAAAIGGRREGPRAADRHSLPDAGRHAIASRPRTWAN